MRRTSQISLAIVIVGGLLGAASASAQTPPSVGAAQSFAVLGGASVSANGAGSVITGDVGVSPGTSITGFPAGATVVPPFGTHSNDGPAIAAQSATTALYISLAGTGGALALPSELGGTAVTPGVYAFSSTANIASGTTLTFNGPGVYIFQVGSALTANVLSGVVLQGGATACNIFWQVTSAATLNGATFAGTVVAQAGVTLGVGASLSGRALTTAAGAVTLSGGNTIGGCSAPAGCPAINFAPPTLSDGRIGSIYSQPFTGSGGTAPYTFTVTGGTLPPVLTLTPSGVLAGGPTAAGTFNFTIRATDANGCFLDRPYTMVVLTAVPTLPQIFVLLLALGLGAAGYARLRFRARGD